MNKQTKKQDNEKKLPKFKATTLGADELCKVTGGMPAETTSTNSICAIDGVTDGDC
ncbi:hypothetical protein SAMN02745121_05296 [Nannocystis exedens]|uniref:Uncharacterized protein n=1 Tax=Nannocystis exedens TaxID=54 RepID=A0A1I2CW83_9BACT|nr:hypothetical protein [Nannocystis exedens]PCC68622.1 hypothetical protein NAEX_01638 [Nannocystis exedens]SFE72548.1 hypothetical protein SAMN02745121_05296 [Nannocystis exedens]